ncbi:MAG: GDP-L-fucose synthase [Phycisphaerae bacterium]|nr:MAG: GDP-L-fucose synthase [Phycisphaerae bacterium]
MRDLREQRVLITGGSGFLGRAVRRALAARGVHAVEAPTHAQADLTRQSATDAMLAASFAGHGPTVLLHLAGFVGGLGANRQWPARFAYDTLAMALHLIEGCRAQGLIDRGLLFLQVGTMCSYPADAPCPYREESLWRGRPDPEIASYGLSKLAILQVLEAYRLQHGLASAYVIPTGFYGPGDNANPATSHVVGALIHKYVQAVRANAPEVVHWGTGTPVRDFIHVNDAAEGLLRAAEVLSVPDPVNLTGGEEVSIRDLADRIARLTGFTGRTVWDTSKGDGQPRRSLCPEKAAQVLNWRAQITLDAGLREAVRAAMNPG